MSRLMIRVSVTDEEGRELNFSTDVPVWNVNKFMNDAAEGIQNVYFPLRSTAIALDCSLDPKIGNKIDVIKIVRYACRIGLKEAKDIVEGLYDGLLFTTTTNDVDNWLKMLGSVKGIRVKMCNFDENDSKFAGLPAGKIW